MKKKIVKKNLKEIPEVTLQIRFNEVEIDPLKVTFFKNWQRTRKDDANKIRVLYKKIDGVDLFQGFKIKSKKLKMHVDTEFAVKLSEIIKYGTLEIIVTKEDGYQYGWRISPNEANYIKPVFISKDECEVIKFLREKVKKENLD